MPLALFAEALVKHLELLLEFLFCRLAASDLLSLLLSTTLSILNGGLSGRLSPCPSFLES